jgi:protein phosphatase
MTMSIPLHSLIFCDQPELFPAHESLSMPQVNWQLVGTERPELAPIVFAELAHRLVLKLSLGERVVVSPTLLSHEQRAQLIKAASAQGAKVATLDLTDPVQLVGPPTDDYQSRWQGITVVGDLHGNHKGFAQVMAWARARQHFVWFLGDVIDYGRDTLATADAVHDAVMAGEAGMIIGNHERKIARWLNHDYDHNKTRLSDGNRITTTAYEALSRTHRNEWSGRFRALLARSSLIEQIGHVTLAHAAVHPSYWTDTPNNEQIERYALYGERDHGSTQFCRSQKWVDHIPTGHLVIVGHTVVSQYPLVASSKAGGAVVFLDTGSGKGGDLSSADLRFGANGLHLELFKKC